MNAHQRENAQLRIALEEAKGLAESRRLELVAMSRQLDEILRLAALQNEQLSDLRTMMRRRMTRRRKGQSETSDSSDSEDEPAAAASSSEGTTESTAPADAESPSAGTASGDTATNSATAGSPEKERTKRPKGAGGRPAPGHLESTTVEQEVCACAHCGSQNLLARDWNETRRIDAVATIAKIRHDVVEVVRCKDCGHTTTAPPPPRRPCRAKKQSSPAHSSPGWSS